MIIRIPFYQENAGIEVLLNMENDER